MLLQFGENLKKVANTYFQWNQERYSDPCDQCFDLPNLKGEIINMAFDRMNVTVESLQESLFLFNIFTSFKEDLDFVLRNIESWCMAHKFVEPI